MTSAAPVGKTKAVREYLSRMIADGRYANGGKLPTERELAEHLAVPRGTVRNALAVLEAEGVVVRRIGSGTYVKYALESNDIVFPAAVTHDASPAEIMDSRILIEPRLAGLAAVHGSVSDFNALAAFNKRAEAALSFEEYERWDSALHQGIARATHNRLLIGIYEKITEARNQADWGELKRRSFTPERRTQYEIDHSLIVAALRARDAAEAEAGMLAHLQHVKQNLIRF